MQKPHLVTLIFLALAAPVMAQSQGLTYERWNNISGNQVELLRQQGINTRAPDHTGTVSHASAPKNVADHYGARLRGLLTAPVTGEYTFHVAGDDNVELWLSHDYDTDTTAPWNRELIAWHNGWTAQHEWTKFPTQRSKSIFLEAGEDYYIEALVKEHEGGDNLSIGWQILEDEDPAVPPFLDNATTTSFSALSASFNPQPDGITEFSVVSGDMWSTQDRGAFFHQPWTGDGVFTIQIGGLSNPHEWSKAGIMLRETLADDSRHAFLLVTPERGTNLNVRNTPGGNAVRPNPDNTTQWEYLRLIRAGNTVTTRVSADGETWHEHSSHTFGSLAESLHVGFAASSHNSQPASPYTGWFGPFQAHPYDPIEVIPGEHLTPHQPHPEDPLDRGLPDAWMIQYGLNPNEIFGDNGPYGDPDNDGLSNFVEYQRGSDPLVENGMPGVLLLERWNNIPKYSLDDLVSTAKFYGEPDSEKLVDPADLTFSGTYFGVRVRGYIIPEVSGEYTFWISGRDGVGLWLSDDLEHGKYAKRLIASLDPTIGTGHGITSNAENLWDQFSSQRSETIYLEAGQRYYIEILNQHGHGGSPHASIAWARDGGPRTSVPADVVESYIITPDDLDDDYLPDAWEIQYGLDPTDNGAIDPIRQGERGDFSGNGLTNREEYLLGTDPSKYDTSGDGISDFDAVALGLDPTVSHGPSGTVSSTLDLTSFTSSSGAWTLTSQGLVPSSFRGSIEWEFSVPTDGFWFLDIATGLLGDLYPNETVDVEVFINGVSLGDRTLVFGSDHKALLRVFTPYLSADTHTIGLDINNIITRRSVSIQSIVVVAPQGVDLNNDGTPDWVTAQIKGENALRPYPPTSRTSPANLEGSARMRGLTTLNGSPVTAGLDRSHWYADLVLDENTATPFSVILEQGFEEVGEITWQATNVFSGETLTVRKGDALKLIGQALSGPTGQSVTLTFGPEGWNGDVGAGGTYTASLASDGDHHIHTLTQSGNYKVRATLADSSTALMSIVVKQADFPQTTRDLLSNTMGTLGFSTSAVSAGAFFDGGESLRAFNPATVDGGTITLQAAPEKRGETYLLARLHKDGPVIGRQSLNLIHLTDVLQNGTIFTTQSEDFPGYQIIRSPIVATDFPEGATIVVTIFRAGVSFLDGTTSLTLTTDDFVNGYYNLEFLFPVDMSGGYCHYTDIYDRDGNYLGRR